MLACNTALLMISTVQLSWKFRNIKNSHSFICGMDLPGNSLILFFINFGKPILMRILLKVERLPSLD